MYRIIICFEVFNDDKDVYVWVFDPTPLYKKIIGLCMVRTILFGIIWLASMGQHKLWILPNLTEDCGFFESFQPWYTYEYCPRGEKKDKDGKKKKQKKAKESDDEKDEQAEGDEDAGEKDNGSQGSNNSISGEPSVSENESTAPPSPEGEVRKRRPRRADADYVMVKK
ncbi:translocation protein Sec62 [Teladorsagia circumcincta]|uniref:Translocation protein SEC62 n=1 Tax=Teladorsagia circumcincta TaxID=45464 RepID=A0A2G9V611_TELCI|nr:translocation protein Sec62 [Teladorsagia circumcincta]